jgi:hypothetical protein
MISFTLGLIVGAGAAVLIVARLACRGLGVR